MFTEYLSSADRPEKYRLLFLFVLVMVMKSSNCKQSNYSNKTTMKRQHQLSLLWNQYGTLRRSRHRTMCMIPYILSITVYIILLVTNNYNSIVFMVQGQQQQSPLTMNGGSVLAMGGNNCVVLAVDKRFGSGRSLIHVRNRPIISLPQSSSIVAFTGLEGDVQSLHIELYAQIIDKYYRNLGFGHRSRMNHENFYDAPTTWASSTIVSVTAITMLTSHILYRRKRAPYYVEPVIIGLKPDTYEEYDPIDTTTTITSNVIDDQSIQTMKQKHRRQRYLPYICCMDMIGAKSESNTFACAGTASKSLYGTAEALWKPNLSSDELVHVCISAFLSALERDCLSGYGATVYLLTPDGITEYDIAGRSD